jgi:DmsE family decaheme c-type cytochrome
MKPQLLVFAVVAFLAPGVVGLPGAAGQSTGKQVVATHEAAPNAADFAGSESCATCHADIAKNFPSNPHSKLALMHGGNGVTCESCHGPAKAHVESGGDATKIFQFTKANAKQVDEKCLGCHVGAHPNFERSAHGEAGVGCTSCHSVHAFKAETHLLKASTESKLCYTCHTDIKAAFAQPFHHKVDEGLVNCSDCHNPHGSFQKKGLNTAAQNDQVCVKCHTETGGPFVFEHPPVKVEGCSSCHSPHGSPNPRLLVRSNVNTLCFQCHITPAGPAHNQAVQYQACTVCHSQIHGSNASSVFFK